MSNISHNADVTIIGAGVCGLATALALRQKGFSVIVLERRVHPESAAGIALRTALKTNMELINDALRLDPEVLQLSSGQAEMNAQLADLQSKAAKQHRQLWGAFDRSIVLDAHSMQYLAALGVEVARIPPCALFELNAQSGLPSFGINLSAREIQPEHDGLTANRLMLQRDWAAQPSLGLLERLLYDVVAKEENIDVIFAADAIDAAHLPQQVTVHFRQEMLERKINSHLLLIADGAGSRKFLPVFGVQRHVVHREHLSVAVFNTRPGEQYGTRSASDIFTSIEIEPGNIFSIATNGTTATCAAAQQNDGQVGMMQAWSTARSRGLESNLSEPPLKIAVEVAYLDRYAGNNWAFIGDAAVAGNPRYGLGAQGGLLWAQELARQIDTLKPDALRRTMERVNAFASDLGRRRSSFELSLQKILDLYAEHGEFLLEHLISNPMLSSMQACKYSAVRQGPSLAVEFCAHLDFSDVLSELDDTDILAPLIRELGEVKLSAKLLINTRGQHWLATLGGSEFINLQMGPVCLQLRSGLLSLQRRRRSWRIGVNNGIAYNGSVRDIQNDGLESSQILKFSELKFSLDDGLFASMLATLMQPGALRSPVNPTAKKDLDISLDMSLESGMALRLGTLCVVPLGDTCVRYNLSSDSSGRLTLRLLILSGALQVTAFMAWSREQHNGFSAPLRSLSSAGHGIFDNLMETLAAAGSTVMRGMAMTFRPSGGAKVTLDLGLPVQLQLKPTEAQQMFSDALRMDVANRYAGQNLKALRQVDAQASFTVP